MSSQKIRIVYLILALVVAFAWWKYRQPRFISGEAVPNFQTQLISGEKFEFYRLKGNYVLLQFWGSWCGPCRAENPQLVQLYRQYHDKGFEIVSIGVESSNARWRKAIESDGMVWPYHIADLKQFDGALPKMFNIHAIPTTFLVNPDGIIIAVNAQPAEINEILAQKTANH